MTDPTRALALTRRLVLARSGARAAGAVSRRLRGGSGRVISGRLLLTADPHAVAALSRGRSVTLVSGTNGKTTTTSLTVAALGDEAEIGTSPDGSNTAVGVAGVLATCDARELVLEVDEAWLPWAIRETAPQTVILTNLSRDQLSRHHEVSRIAATWRSALAGVPLVIANADDPAVTWAALSSRRQLWVAVGSEWRNDSAVCPACQCRCLVSATGWACTSCDLSRPEPDWQLEGHTLHDGTTRIPLAPGLPGRFNLANAAMATVAAHTLRGVAPADAAARLVGVRSVAGRFEQRRLLGRDVRIMLAKNPAGWLEILQLIGDEQHGLVLILNAEGVDGRDPSWLYDVSFAALRGRTIAVQGDRATDLLVRLEHDDVRAHAAPGPLTAALWTLPRGRVDVIANYSAFRRVVQEARRGF